MHHAGHNGVTNVLLHITDRQQIHGKVDRRESLSVPLILWVPVMELARFVMACYAWPRSSRNECLLDRGQRSYGNSSTKGRWLHQGPSVQRPMPGVPYTSPLLRWHMGFDHQHPLPPQRAIQWKTWGLDNTSESHSQVFHSQRRHSFIFSPTMLCIGPQANLTWHALRSSFLRDKSIYSVAVE